MLLEFTSVLDFELAPYNLVVWECFEPWLVEHFLSFTKCIIYVSFLAFVNSMMLWFLIFAQQELQNIVFFLLIGLLGKQWRWSRVNCLHPVSVKFDASCYFNCYFNCCNSQLTFHASTFQIFLVVLSIAIMLCSYKLHLIMNFICCLSDLHQMSK